MSTQLISIMSVLVATATSAAAHPSKLSEIRDRGRLIVSVKNEGPKSGAAHKDPAHFQKRGFEIAIARRIAKKILGTEEQLELKILPKAKRISAVIGGEVDLVISMIAITDERKMQVDFSTPYYLGGLAMVANQGDSFSKIEDLGGKRIGLATQTGNDPKSALDRVLTEKGVHALVVRCPDFKHCIESLRAHKLDAFVSMNPNIEAFLASTPKGFKRIGGLLTREEYAVAVKKENGDLRQAVDEAIAELKTSGELAHFAGESRLAYPEEP